MVRPAKSVDPINLTVGRRIRLKRELMGLSQSALGDIVGVSRIKIGKYESGANEVPAGMLFSLANFFDVDVCYFYEDDGQKKALQDLAEVDPVLNKESLSLLKDFSAIADQDVQRKFAAVMERAAQLLTEKKN